jgi:hypothetical protein
MVPLMENESVSRTTLLEMMLGATAIPLELLLDAAGRKWGKPWVVVCTFRTLLDTTMKLGCRYKCIWRTLGGLPDLDRDLVMG